MLTPSLAENQRVPCSVLITSEDTSLSTYVHIAGWLMYVYASHTAT